MAATTITFPDGEYRAARNRSVILSKFNVDTDTFKDVGSIHLADGKVTLDPALQIGGWPEILDVVVYEGRKRTPTDGAVYLDAVLNYFAHFTYMDARPGPDGEA